MINISNIIWKDIPGYYGIYQVSNNGIVRSIDRIVYYKNGRKAFTKGKVLKAWAKKSGYIVVDLYKNGKQSKHHVHRLVAEAFIPNPYLLPQVNHKDENKANNCVDNLEWCSCKYNLNYGTHNERVSLSHINNPSHSRKVV